ERPKRYFEILQRLADVGGRDPKRLTGDVARQHNATIAVDDELRHRHSVERELAHARLVVVAVRMRVAGRDFGCRLKRKEPLADVGRRYLGEYAMLEINR